MHYAIEQARKSPPSPSKFCVGAVLVDADANQILSTGFSEELPRDRPVLYTTMEPCNERLSGSRTCVERILGLNGAIKVVYIGIREPDTFIKRNEAIKRLEEGGVKVVLMDDNKELEQIIFDATFAGHEKQG
ncbi:hypothetical protein NEMBOFW57_008781 [Staphylotrichum longicolle]|uniref:CMP/dCMP-type deaminase domain-containing protein n=1 Tax=Staphylotrichum longicolle TaxID=669026 RepID=A0AAD4HXI7_9PEZI|nr:hypothetical protein NEMBOFW57_008781 [Staphylotrichum longicolle]